jgi:hypothetical protein
MGSRGVLFAIDDDAARRLLDAADDAEVMEVIEDIEEAWEDGHVAETDKAWDAIHRALTDGQLEWANGAYPLNHVILGGRDLMAGDDYVAVLKAPDQVRDVAEAVRAIDDSTMAALYDRNVPSDYDASYGDEDRVYTVDWFRPVRDLFLGAADSGRWVVFTADL